MKFERIIWALALLIVGGASFYMGRENGVAAGQAQLQASAESFFAQRSAGQGGQRQVAPGGGFQGQAANGEVLSVDGSTLTIKNQRDGSTLTVQVGQQTRIRTQADGQLSDIKVGDTVVAIGARSGDTIQAETIQIGGLAGLGPRSAPPASP